MYSCCKWTCICFISSRNTLIFTLKSSVSQYFPPCATLYLHGNLAATQDRLIKNKGPTVYICIYTRQAFQCTKKVYASEMNATRIWYMSILVKLDMLFRMAPEFVRSDFGKRVKLNVFENCFFVFSAHIIWSKGVTWKKPWTFFVDLHQMYLLTEFHTDQIYQFKNEQINIFPHFESVNPLTSGPR